MRFSLLLRPSRTFGPAMVAFSLVFEARAGLWPRYGGVLGYSCYHRGTLAPLHGPGEGVPSTAARVAMEMRADVKGLMAA